MTYLTQQQPEFPQQSGLPQQPVLPQQSALPQQSVLPPLVVGSNPAETERATRPAFVFGLIAIVVAVLGGLLLVAWVASTGGFVPAIIAVVPVAIGYGSMLFMTVYMATLRGAQSVARTVLNLDEAGFQGNIVEGRITLPWSAIERLSLRTRGRYRIVTFHLAQSVTASTPGVDMTLSPRAFKRLHTYGFQVSQTAIDTPLDTVIAASRAFTGGRLTVG